MHLLTLQHQQPYSLSCSCAAVLLPIWQAILFPCVCVCVCCMRVRARVCVFINVTQVTSFALAYFKIQLHLHTISLRKCDVADTLTRNE